MNADGTKNRTRALIRQIVPALCIAVAVPALSGHAQTYWIDNPVAVDACVSMDGEVVTHYRKRPQSTLPSTCSDQRAESVRAVKDTVKRYWSVPFRERYGLFSKPYKATLARVYKVTSPETYAKKVDPERISVREVYERIEAGADAARVTVLSRWSQEGYEGVQTFIFDLVKEGDRWVISDVMY